MAVIKTSALVDEIKGSIGGTVFQVSKWGQIAKQKSTRKPTVSASLSVQWDIVSFAIEVWRGLSPLERQSWVDNAAAYPSTDRYGNLVIPTAYNLFMRVALRLPIPAIRTMNSCSPLSFSLPIWSMVENAVPGQLFVELTRSPGVLRSDIAIFASPMYNLGVSNPRHRFRKIHFLYNNIAQLSADLAPFYSAQFGPIENDKHIWVKMVSRRNNQPQFSGHSEFVITTSGF